MRLAPRVPRGTLKSIFFPIGRKAGTAYNLIVVICNIIEMPNSSQNFTLVYLAVYGARPQNSELWHWDSLLSSVAIKTQEWISFFGHKQIWKCSLEKPCIKVFKFHIPPKFYLSLRIKPSLIPIRPRPGVVTIFQRVKFVSTRGRVISYISALWNTLEYFSFPLIGFLGCSHSSRVIKVSWPSPSQCPQMKSTQWQQ